MLSPSKRFLFLAWQGTAELLRYNENKDDDKNNNRNVD